jgi:hypothetical protein
MYIHFFLFLLDFLNFSFLYPLIFFCALIIFLLLHQFHLDLYFHHQSRIHIIDDTIFIFQFLMDLQLFAPFIFFLHERMDLLLSQYIFKLIAKILFVYFFHIYFLQLLKLNFSFFDLHFELD